MRSIECTNSALRDAIKIDCVRCKVPCIRAWAGNQASPVVRDEVYIFSVIPYSCKIWWRIRFGSLADCLSNRQIKIRQNFLLTYNIHMAILCWTTKFKSTNKFEMAIRDPTAKFNSCRHFWLYSICFHSEFEHAAVIGLLLGVWPMIISSKVILLHLHMCIHGASDRD